MVASCTHDVLIIGHGLAGSVLSERLRKRGLRHHIFDHPKKYRSTQAAAGVVNPISLRRDLLTWRAKELLPLTRSHFKELGDRLGVTAWHDLDLIKIFPTANEVKQWHRAMNSDASDLLSLEERPEVAQAGIAAPLGYGVVKQCAWVDLTELLRAHRTELIADGSLSEFTIEEKDIVTISDGVRVHGRSAKWIIHCEGPFHQLSGLVPVKGEVLTLRIPGLRLKNIVHRGVFLLPIGDECFKLGSTFVWDNAFSGPTGEGRDHLLAKLKELLPHEVEILDHQAGVRPAARDRRPILGKIAPGHAVMNGLGARGVMVAPWCADHLIDHLFEGKPLHPEVDLQRFVMQ